MIADAPSLRFVQGRVLRTQARPALPATSYPPSQKARGTHISETANKRRGCQTEPPACPLRRPCGERLFSFVPPGLDSIFLQYPRLAPWAAFCRRFAAGVVATAYFESRTAVFGITALWGPKFVL
jgi:hypothetical protein